MFLRLFCIRFGLECSIDERYKRIHNEDGERHAFGIGSEHTDDDGEQTAAAAEDNHTPWRHR